MIPTTREVVEEIDCTISLEVTFVIKESNDILPKDISDNLPQCVTFNMLLIKEHQYLDLLHLPSPIGLLPIPIHIGMMLRAIVLNGMTETKALNGNFSRLVPLLNAISAKSMGIGLSIVPFPLRSPLLMELPSKPLRLIQKNSPMKK